MNIARRHNIEAFRSRARRALPRPIFEYMDGGAEDEISLRRATAAFDDLELLPRSLVDVSKISGETEIFGRRIPLPLMLAPTGLTRMFHKDAELAVARACNYDGLVLTIDTVVAGKRERDLINGLSLPPRLTARGFLGMAARPGWSLPALFGRSFDFVNIAHRVATMEAGPTSLHDYVNGQFDRSLTWRDVEWLASRWGGPLAIKGILRPDDAMRAAEAGADTVLVSNHGGRQLDTAVAPIDQIAPIADAVGGRLKIICDGGIRRGSHIIKALSLGADACSIGRPYLYALAAGGSAGVTAALNILREEFERNMILVGAPNVACLDRSFVHPA